MRKFHGIVVACLLLTSGAAKAVNFGTEIQNAFAAQAFGAGSYGPYVWNGGFGLTSAIASYSGGIPFSVGSSNADLTTGRIAATVNGEAGSMSGVLVDRFYVDLPDGVGSQLVNVTWRVTGSTFGTQLSPNGFWSSLRIQGWPIGGPGGQDLFFTKLSPYFASEGHETPQWWSNGNHDLVYTGNIWITEEWVYALNNDLGIGYSSTGAQVSYTSSFNIDLPAGSRIISASGTLLSQVPGPAIPEPASWAMMIAGFGLTGAALRRRRHLHAVGHAA